MTAPRFTVGSGRAAVRWQPPNWYVHDQQRGRVVATFRGGNGQAEQRARAHAAHLNEEPERAPTLFDQKGRIV